MLERGQIWQFLPDHSSAKTASLADQAPELMTRGLIAELLSARLAAQIGPLPRHSQTRAAARRVL
jgi:hypothetical protein